jgi:hypothetical protein
MSPQPEPARLLLRHRRSEIAAFLDDEDAAFVALA